MIVNLDTRRIIAHRPHTALSFRERFFGLMGRNFKRLPYDALLFARCNAIHTAFMCMKIDVLFVNRDNRIVALRENLAPWRLAWGGRQAWWTVELPAGAARAGQCAPGQLLNMNMELTEESLLALRGFGLEEFVAPPVLPAASTPEKPL